MSCQLTGCFSLLLCCRACRWQQGRYDITECVLTKVTPRKLPQLDLVTA